MPYTYDIYRTQFTPLQIARMYGILDLVRTEISQLKFILNNQFNGVNLGGSLSVNSIQTPSGVPYYTHQNGLSDFLLTTNNLAIVNSGVKYRQNSWDNEKTEYKGSYLYSFGIFSSSSVIKNAEFLPTKTAVIAGISDVLGIIPISLQDPWTSQNQTEFLPSSGSKEVFLGEDRNPQIPLKPYYQIKTDRVKAGTGSLAGLSLSFQNWSSTGTEPLIGTQPEAQPVVFNTVGATVTANYKAILASQNQGWISSGSFSSTKGKTSVGYISNGTIWLHDESPSGNKESKIYQLNTGEELAWVQSFSVSRFNETPKNGIIFSTKEPGESISWVYATDPTKPNGTEPFVLYANSGLDKNLAFPVFQDSQWPCTGFVVVIHQGANLVYNLYFGSGCTNVSNQTINLNGKLTSSSKLNLATDGFQKNWITWVNNGTVYGLKFNPNSLTWDAVKTIYSGGSYPITDVRTSLDGSGNLCLMMTRTYNSTKNQVAIGKVYENSTIAPLTVIGTSGSYQPYLLDGFSVEGSKWLAKIGLSFESVTWNLWKNDGSIWIKETSSIPADRKLLHGEVDVTVGEQNISSIFALKEFGVSWPIQPPMNKISTSQHSENLLSIAGHQPTDTVDYFIDINPQEIDSIIIDTLGVWSIAIQGSGFITETVNDLKLFGSSELVVTTTESGTSRTIKFIPNLVKWDVWVVDPSGNKVRMGKENSEEESGSESIKTEVAVYPNPFNPETRINIRLTEPTELKVRVYNVVGQLVADLANGHHDIGDYSFRFDGKSLASGTYFYRVEIGEKVKTGKLQLLK